MLPNFIVIGAAKAGTTALYWYLAEHPEVFMSPMKETNYFAYGVNAEGQLLYGDPDEHHFPVKLLNEYERLFAEAGHAGATGEASPIYLECPQAASRIRAVLPGARIICSLRHPVDRAYSDYVMHLRHHGLGFDPSRDLTATSTWARPNSRWMLIGKYHEQLTRYYDVFPRNQIHVFLFDDLQRNPTTVVQDVYRFVNVNSSFIPDFSTPHALGGVPVSSVLEGFFSSRATKSVKRWLPLKAANWVRRFRGRTLRQAPALPPELRKELTGPFRDDIARTSELIGRSLEHWL